MKGGLVTLVPADEETLFTIYVAVRSSDLRLDGDAAATRQLLALQLGAQRQTYRRLFPAASWNLILCDAVPVGWIVAERSEREVRCLDIGLLQGVRRRGIASSVLRVLQQEADEADVPFTLSVRADNVAARALYDRVGFQEMSATAGHLHLAWRRTTSAGDRP